MELLTVPPDRDRKCLCRGVGRDQVCFRCRPNLPSAWQRMLNKDSHSDRADGIRPAWLWAMRSTWGCGRPRNDYAVNTRGSLEPQIPGPTAYRNWWWAQ